MTTVDITQDETKYLVDLLQLEAISAQRRADVQKSAEYDKQYQNCKRITAKLLESSSQMINTDYDKTLPFVKFWDYANDISAYDLLTYEMKIIDLDSWTQRLGLSSIQEFDDFMDWLFGRGNYQMHIKDHHTDDWHEDVMISFNATPELAYLWREEV